MGFRTGCYSPAAQGRIFLDDSDGNDKVLLVKGGVTRGVLGGFSAKARDVVVAMTGVLTMRASLWRWMKW